MAFVDAYLPQMTVCVEIAEVLELKFDGICEDGEFIHFRESPAGQPNVPSRVPPELRRRLEQQTERVWEREHERYLSSIQDQAPSLLYHVWLIGYVEDPAFPDLQVDTSMRRMRFRWKSMLSTMFGEIEYRKWNLKQLESPGLIGAMGIADVAEAERALQRTIEMHIRKSRPRNSGWNTQFSSWRRQEWQLDALLAYRLDQELELDIEEGWGTFYDDVRPRHGLISCVE